MPADENKALVRRFYNQCSQGNWEILDELLDPDIVDHNLPPGLPPGLEGVKIFFASLRSAFPDLSFSLPDLFVEGDRVVARFNAHATHSGEFLGVPATGKRVTYQVIDILRIADGKIVERWGMADLFSILQQIGALPAPADAA